MKQNPTINIRLKRSRYISPHCFLMFVSFPRVSWRFFLINFYISKKIKTSGIKQSFYFVLKPKTTLFYLLSFTVSRYITRCYSLSFVILVRTRCSEEKCSNKILTKIILVGVYICKVNIGKRSEHSQKIKHIDVSSPDDAKLY